MLANNICADKETEEEQEDSNLPNLVAPRPCHIPHPLHTRVVALLKHLEIANQQARAGKHQQAKVHAEWRPAPSLLVRHARELGLGAQHKFALSSKATNLPHNHVLGRLVLGLALGAALRDPRRVERRGDLHHDIGRKQLGPKVGAHTDAVFHLGLAHLVDNGVHFEGKVDVLGRAVPHQLELAVGRDEADDAVAVELAQLDALVELAVLERDASSSGLGRLAPHPVAAGQAHEAVLVEKEAVVKSELALGRAAEVGAHDDLAVDVGAQDGTRCAHEQVHVLDHVHEGFVLAVLDVGLAPG